MRLLCAFVVSLLFITLSADSVYVTDSLANLVYVIDVNTNTVTATITIDPSRGNGIAISPDQTTVYVAVFNPPNSTFTVDVINILTNTKSASITFPDVSSTEPFQIAFTPNGAFAYVTNRTVEEFFVINTQTLAISPITTPALSNATVGVAITPNGNLAYMTTDVNEVLVYDTATNSLVTTIPVSNSSFGIAITPDSKTAYVTLVGGSAVNAIDIASNTVSATIAVGSFPVDIAITPDGTRAYVTNNGSASVSVINTSTNTNVGPTITVGASPTGIAINAEGTFAYVANNASANVSVINLQTNLTTATVAISGSHPNYLAISGVVSSSSQISGKQVRDRALTQTDYVNIITWNPPAGFVPVKYQVFRDAALTQLAATLPASSLEFKDINRKKHQSYSYFVIAVNSSGNTTTVGNVTVP